MELKTHWTEDVDRFLFKIGADFMLQLEKVIEAEGTKQAELATALGVSEGRVSQVLNTPGNLTLRKIVQYTKAVGRKVSLVVYDDGDTAKQRGPISGEIFTACWHHAGRPFDYFDLQDCMAAAATADFMWTQPSGGHYIPNYDRKQSGTTPYRTDSPALEGPIQDTANNTGTQLEAMGVR